jgi:hypothetical protein
MVGGQETLLCWVSSFLTNHGGQLIAVFTTNLLTTSIPFFWRTCWGNFGKKYDFSVQFQLHMLFFEMEKLMTF